MTFRRHIVFGLTNTIKKIGTKQVKKKTNTKSPSYGKVVQNKPILKHKYSNFWRFHHGDEL